MPGSAVPSTDVIWIAGQGRDAARLAIDAIPLGDRPWRVFTELWRWPGGERGRGAGAIVGSPNELTPRPEVVDRRGRVLYPGGLSDNGDIQLIDLSITYLEEQLDPKPLAAGDAWFYRLTDSSPSAQRSLYFAVSTKAPPRKADPATDWIVTLVPVETPR